MILYLAVEALIKDFWQLKTKNPEGDFQVEGEMKEIYSCELSIWDSVIIITLIRIKERTDMAALFYN